MSNLFIFSLIMQSLAWRLQFFAQINHVWHWRHRVGAFDFTKQATKALDSLNFTEYHLSSLKPCGPVYRVFGDEFSLALLLNESLSFSHLNFKCENEHCYQRASFQCVSLVKTSDLKKIIDKKKNLFRNLYDRTRAAPEDILVSANTKSKATNELGLKMLNSYKPGVLFMGR